MTVTKTSDKIMVYMCKDFYSTGNIFSSGTALCEQFPDVPEHIVFEAIRTLHKKRFLSADFSDDVPSEITLDVSAVESYDENASLKKGYTFIKEIRDWLVAFKPL